MPKIIENLDEEIAKTALELFKKSSYRSVSMRKIASEVGIAVGTLYNYYPNKWELYIEVFEESWRKTYQILEKSCRELDEDYLINYLEIIYQEMKSKKAIVRELFRFIMNDLEIDEETKNEKFKRVRFPKVLIDEIYELFVVVLEKEFQINLEDEKLYRLFTMVQTHIPLLQQNFAEEEDNIQFLYEVVSSYIEKHYNLGC